MNFKGTLIVVQDMEKAKRFYHEVLGLDVVEDFGANVILSQGIFLQTADTWTTFIRKPEKEIVYANNASELYFETDNMDAFINKLTNHNDILYLHPPLEHNWGQRAVRFYDRDGHIIEVGENMVMVVKRFVESGLSIEDTAKRMDVDINYINSCIGQ